MALRHVHGVDVRHIASRIAARIQAERQRRTPLARLVAALPPEWDAAGPTSDAEMVFIGGCPRSGTTLLREMLGRHPHLAIGPEGGFFHQRPKIARLAVQWSLTEDEVIAILRQSPSRPAFVEAMARVQMERSGKPRYVEKTPVNCRSVSQILGSFPNGRFIHIIRDGRDTVCSLRSYGGAVLRNGTMESIAADNDIADVARWWVNDVSLGMATRDHPRCHEIFYEKLLAEPERELRRICDFLGEAFHPAMLDPTASDMASPAKLRFVFNHKAAQAVDRTSAGRWRSDLSASERRDFDHAAGALLIALGYANDTTWVEQSGG